MLLATIHHLHGPHVDWIALSPFIAITAGALIVLLVGLIGDRTIRERVTPLIALVTLGTAIAFLIAHFQYVPHIGKKPGNPIIAGAMTVDELGDVLDLIFCVSALATVIMSLRSPAPRDSGQGEYNALLLFSVLGMMILVSAVNLITVFVGFELLSIPLYVLCASEFRREGSLESGLKYLVIGSVGSATLVYGFALIYGATGSTEFSTIAGAISRGPLVGGILGDPLLLTGLALVLVGFAFKASVAPFHQWTPDVYEGAPTPITAFMATATKAAALGVFIRFFDVAAIGAQNKWGPILAALAAITIIVGNVGALGQSSVKRMLAYSGVAQAGYMLGGVVVGTKLGASATVLYLMVYMAMNLCAFAVITAVQKGEDGDADISRFKGLGTRAPWLAWPMTIAMLALAGIPGTVGFIGKFQLIHAFVDGDYTWLGIVLVIGSMISLGYYLRVVATMWMARPDPVPTAAPARLGGLAPVAGGSPEADAALRVDADWPSSAQSAPYPEIVLVALVFGALSIVFGVAPEPLFQLAAHAGNALVGIF
ncbi:MAG TPA: NADH-quinone oxidoreductase subunit N [Solirubrobacteraceae bacterium]|nr:NADH-quinone oxidoreductase subunit N [Solirubrobacteraceae bacterium]